MLRISTIFFTIIFFSCSEKKADLQEAPAVDASSFQVALSDAQIKNAGIETGTAELRDMQTTLKVNGLVDVPPQNMITISFPPGGYLKSTSMLPGMRVRKGQVLAVMEDQAIIQMQQDYLMAKSRSEFLQKELTRQQLLNTTKASSDKVYEQAASNYELESITVSALKEKLLLVGINPLTLKENAISRTVNIYSPISGYISTVRVNIGKYVNPADILFELVNINDLHLMLNVFEKDLPSILPEQSVQAFLTGDTSKIFEARVMLVSKMVDSTRSATVHCHFLGDPSGLLPGMFMNATIATSKRSQLTVPEEAVVQSGDSSYVFMQVQRGQFLLTPVRVMFSQNGTAAITSDHVDLNNKTIVTRNAYAALMKLKNTGE